MRILSCSLIVIHPSALGLGTFIWNRGTIMDCLASIGMRTRCSTWALVDVYTT